VRSIPGLSWGIVLQCLQCILHLTAPSAAEHSLAVQGLLAQDLLPASVKAWGAVQGLPPAAAPMQQELLSALLAAWEQLLAQMPLQTGSDGPEAATLAQAAAAGVLGGMAGAAATQEPT
jgi:hypothetical protein